jgi:hypothetical protein
MPFEPPELAKIALASEALLTLASEALLTFGELRLRVSGSSMLPAVRPDDVLLIRRCRFEEAEPGDIVLYLRRRRLFVHRVLSRSDGQLVAQGDGLAEPDPPISKAELLGKVVRVTRRGRVVRHQSEPGFPARLAAMLFRRSALAGRVFIRLQGLHSRAGL